METIFFGFLATRNSFSVSNFSTNASFRVVKTDFWLVQTIFYIFFSETPAGESFFFLSSGYLFLNESFIPAIGEGYFSLMKTVTLLESFFLLAETVTAMNGNKFLKTELILAGGN